MTMLDPQSTVAQVVLDHSACAPVFQRHRIDYCCHGDRSIAVACADRGVPVDQVVAELDDAIAARTGHEVDAASLDTPALIGHIVATHHDYLRKTLPFVLGLAAKVRRVHGARAPKLVDVDELVVALDATLGSHLDDEEERLFPSLIAKPVDQRQVAAELAAMAEDHLVVGDLLARLRDAADDFAPPDWACGSYRTLLAELVHLEGDILRHVHLENHALMPRFASR
ncbi:MAG: DUF542 domain-containing protein [Myxococcales bacterium]|nr:DUF542 domain-containing protein [Myxococcales bacterium]